MNIRLHGLLVLFLLFYCATGASAQKNYLKLYENKVTDTSLVPIEAGINYLMLKDRKGRFILQNYYYETLNMYKQTSYKNKELTIKHGAMIWKDDEGNLLEEGQYVYGQKAGVWKHYTYKNHITFLSASGAYVNDQKEGIWVSTDSSGVKTKEELYTNGIVEKTTQFKRDWTEMLIPNIADTSIQTMPSFPCHPLFERNGDKCGELSLQTYLRDNIKYPKRARKLEIMGTAYLDFIVEKDGSVAQIHIINGISDDIKKECLRMMSKMPKWTPGQVYSLPIRFKFTLPIRFRLE